MSGDRHDLGRLLYQDAQVRIVERDEPPAVLVIGEIDITNSSALARALNSCRRDGQPLTVDTGALTFVDMSGLRVLALPGVPAEHRWIRLTNLTPFQKRLLELVGWADKLQQPIL
jgi:anti-anti-sigma factor